MAGLRKILKQNGSIKVNGVLWVWDYAKDEPRIKANMTKDEFAASEKAKWMAIKQKENGK